MNGNDASFIRAIRGPVTLITVGVLFALNNFTPYRFDQTWPLILIVFGLMSLLRRGVAQRMPPDAPAGVPPYAWPPPAGYTGGYRQSPYPATAPPAAPPEPVKGGFGTSAPPRSPDPGTAPPSGDPV